MELVRDYYTSVARSICIILRISPDATFYSVELANGKLRRHVPNALYALLGGLEGEALQREIFLLLLFASLAGKK
jgi:hypothetical protein